MGLLSGFHLVSSNTRREIIMSRVHRELAYANFQKMLRALDKSVESNTRALNDYIKAEDKKMEFRKEVNTKAREAVSKLRCENKEIEYKSEGLQL